MRFFSKLKPGEAANKYILVHCTHGHNRTGFMIIHYLMRTQMNSVEQVYFIPALQVQDIGSESVLWLQYIYIPEQVRTEIGCSI